MCEVRSMWLKEWTCVDRKGIMCLKEIGLNVRDLLTIMGAIVNNVRWTVMHSSFFILHCAANMEIRM